MGKWINMKENNYRQKESLMPNFRIPLHLYGETKITEKNDL